MKITEVKRQRNNENRYNIFIDGEFCFSASDEDIVKYSIYEEAEFNGIELSNIIRYCEETKAYNYALNMLSIKDYTSRELARKLKQKSFSEQTAEAVLEKLKALNLINDQIYTQKYVNDCLNFKKYGKNKIMYNLDRMGIKVTDKSSIAINEETEYKNAWELGIRKFNSLRDKPNKRDKVFRFLFSKGYEADLIKRVIREIFKNDEEDYIKE